jgi:GNAT superfamily N-acetyltransferase
MSQPSALFASTELAAAIEAAEARMIAAGTLAAGRRDPSVGAFVHPIAGGFACWAGPDNPLDKVAGAGFGPLPGEAELADLEAVYATRQSAVQFEVSTLADPALVRLLTRRGYLLTGFENVSARTLDDDAPPPPSSEPTVERCQPADGPAWLDAVVEGFAHPDAQGIASHEEFPREVLARVIDDLTSAPGFERFLARRAGEVAGGASMRLDPPVALLSGAATLPAHRRCGVQTALLHHRLAVAREAGCRLAVVTTQPGSKSQQNVARQGFQLLYARAVLVRQPG